MAYRNLSHNNSHTTIAGVSTVTRYFDTDGRVSRMYATPGNTNFFEYAQNNVISKIENRTDTSLTTAFRYDRNGRVQSAEMTGNKEAFTYDNNGNRIQHTVNNLANRYTTASSGNRLTSVSGSRSRTYAYDATGNVIGQTASGGQKYTARYDGFGRLAALDLDGTAGEAAETYLYNAFNQRVRKTGPRGDYSYLYSPDGLLIAETAKNSSAIGSIYVYLDGEIIAVIRNNQIYAVINDHLGRPERIIDQNKAVVWRAVNNSFDRTVVQSTAAFGTFNIGLPGQYYDDSSKLWYNWHRYYDSATGRYIQSDPIGMMGGLNTYAYAENSPMNLIDPWGLCAQGTESSNGLSVVSGLNNAGGIFSGAAALNFLSGDGNRWKGKNGRWYNRSWGENQWTGARSKVLANAYQIKATGQGLFLLGLGLSGMEAHHAYKRGDNIGLVKAASDVAWGTAATFGGSFGLVGGAAYFGTYSLVNIPAVNGVTIQPIVDSLCAASGNC